MARGTPKDPLARGLGIFSVALGAAQLLAPRRLSRLIGLADEHPVLMRVMGARELATGVGIFSERRPVKWLWARVAGDAVDLALLGTSVVEGASSTPRVAGAIAAVGGVTVADVADATMLARAEDADATRVARKAITVNRTPEDVYWFWHDFENLPRFMTHLESVETLGEGRSRWRARGPAGGSVEWEAELVDDRPDELIAWRSVAGSPVETSGFVRFVPAPGNRGTEIHAEVRYTPPGGALGAAVAKLFGEEPSTQLHDDLRRFKNVVETGEVVRSEGTPSGTDVREHLQQRPARPVEAGATGGAR
jgi:uncharacterized membrane protein